MLHYIKSMIETKFHNRHNVCHKIPKVTPSIHWLINVKTNEFFRHTISSRNPADWTPVIDTDN